MDHKYCASISSFFLIVLYNCRSYFKNSIISKENEILVESLESDGHGQVSEVLKNGRENFAFLALIAVWSVPGESR